LVRILPGVEELVLVLESWKGSVMPDTLRFLLYLAAFACFLLAAFPLRARWASRVNLIALGLAFWVFINLVAALRAVN
jgi:hypothetical protein